VAHDLRSPLNQIKALLNLAINSVDELQKKEFINIALKSTEILRERINRILDIEAINSRKVDVKCEPIKVGKLLKDLESNYSELANQKGLNIAIETKVNENEALNADYDHITQVLENLMSNAIKFSPRNKSIKLGGYKEQGQIVISIADEGPGIPKEEQQMLFKKFSKLSIKPTGNEESSGLGLSIVKKYVDAMNGKVWCESEVGKGAAFKVAFPLAN